MFCAKSRPAGPATTDFGDILAAARRIVRTIVVTSEAPAAPCFSAGVGVGAGTSGTIACGGSEAPVVPGLQVADSPVALAVAGTRDRLTADTFAARQADNLLVAAHAIPEADVVTALRAMGHVVVVPGEDNQGRRSSDAWGNMNTVLWDRRDNTLSGGSDPRTSTGKAVVVRTP